MSKVEEENYFFGIKTECTGKGEYYFLKIVWVVTVHAKSPKIKIKTFFFPCLTFRYYIYQLTKEKSLDAENTKAGGKKSIRTSSCVLCFY